MSKYEFVNELYKDIIKKRNKYKIDLDNYITESEIIKRNIEYKTSTEDDSKFFSPRNTENGIESLEEMNDSLEKYEKLIEETREDFDYYDDYCIRISNFLKMVDEEHEEIIHEKSDENKDEDQDISYNLSLNYDLDGIKEKLISLENKLDVCLKIFDNDRERIKQEIKNISKSLNQIIDSIN